jgi:twitching motility protein PilT
MKYDIVQLLKTTIEYKSSDLHITVGLPPMIRIDGELKKLSGDILLSEDTKEMVEQMTTEKQFATIEEKGQVDMSYSVSGWGRFRVNIYKQRGSYSIACRVVAASIPSLEDLRLPKVISEFTDFGRGLILLTGPTGSGKSTTLASMINLINAKRKEHIITLEDPIEYLHKHNLSMINQREIGYDTADYAGALRAALRQDPDVILIGEMRDLETIATALTSAETGHLVMSTLHTVGAAKTIDRIIDVFPPHQQQQIRVQLASVIKAVVSQQLIKRADGPGRVVATEIMVVTPAIQNLVREGKTHQINSIIQMNSKMGMVTMDAYLHNLYKKGIISLDDTIFYSTDPDTMRGKLGISKKG